MEEEILATFLLGHEEVHSTKEAAIMKVMTAAEGKQKARHFSVLLPLFPLDSLMLILGCQAIVN